MKFLLVFILVFSGVAEASTYGFAFASFSATTLLGGSITTSIQVPGTFAGVNPADPTAGRYLKSATLWADSPAAGDQITLLQIVDIDGVVPAPVRAAFPNYPVIFDMLDTISGVQSTVLLPPDPPLVIEAFDTSGSAGTKFVPSGLYFKVTFQTGGLSIGKTLRVLIRWGVWQ